MNEEKKGIVYKAYKCLEFGGLLFWTGMGILWACFFALFYIVLNPQMYSVLSWYHIYPQFIMLGGLALFGTIYAIKMALSLEEMVR